MSQEYKMSWPVYLCEINTNGEISKLSEDHRTSYDPFDSYNKSNDSNLYRKLASINENNETEILKFINTYGYLGLGLRKESKTLSIKVSRLSLLKNQFKTYIESEKIEKKELFQYYKDEVAMMKRILPEKLTKIYTESQSESLKDIQYEIRNLNIVLQLIEYFATNQDVTDTKHRMDFLLSRIVALQTHYTYTEEYIKEFTDKIMKYSPNLYQLERDARFTLTYTINNEIQYTKPSITYDYIDEKFITAWQPNTLLSAMYVMIYMDLIQDRKSRRCKNPTCNNWFEIYGNDERKEFCSTKCAQSSASREYRKRKKEGKV